MALLIFGFLIFLKKKRPVLLDGEEASLAAFGALISGWPGLIIFFPLILLLMIFQHLFLSLLSSSRVPSLSSLRVPSLSSLRRVPPARGDEAISMSPSPAENVSYERLPLTPLIFIAAFAALFFASYVLNYLGLDVLIPAKSAM